MPKTKSAKLSRVAIEKKPTPPLEDTQQLVTVSALNYEERQRLAAIYADPVFRKAWNNAQAQKPTLFPGGNTNEPMLGNNRLHQLQGWEMFRVALIKEAHERPLAPQKIQDNFPDAGTIEAEMRRRTGQPSTR